MTSENLPQSFDAPEDEEESINLESQQEIASDEMNHLLNDPLAHLNRHIHEQAIAAVKMRKQVAEERDLPAFEQYAIPALEADLKQSLGAESIDAETLRLVKPLTRLKGKLDRIDLSWNAVGAAKSVGKPIPEAANHVADVFRKHPMIESVATTGPFINIRLNWNAFYSQLSEQMKDSSDTYGHNNMGKEEVIAFDFSSPNVAKNMTLAHLRSTVIGRSISRLYDANGFTTLRINHLGDWGKNIGELIFQWKEELAHNPEGFQERYDADPVGTLMHTYRRYHERLDAEEPGLADKAHDLFHRLEEGDQELNEMRQTVADVTLEEFESIYRRLGIDFDVCQGESFYRDRMSSMVQDGIDKSVLHKESDSSIKFPGQELTDPITRKKSDANMRMRYESGLKSEYVVKPSGGSVYMTRDLAAIRYRTEVLGAKQVLYVIGKEQARHCLILFNVADQMGYSPIGSSRHLSFGHLNIDGKKLKTRKGKVILLNDVLDETTQSAEKLIQEGKIQRSENPELNDNDKEVAEMIGVGTVIYNDLKQDRKKDIKFDPESAGSVSVGGAPYLQYTFARLSGILRKLDDLPDDVRMPDAISDTERGLMVSMALFPQVVSEAGVLEAPHKIATYLEDLAQQANRFYETHHVGRAEKTEQQYRQKLITQLLQVFSNATYLLGIKMPDKI